MTLDQVQYFLVLCRELSFTRAAKLCGISQPSMTNAISALEAEFGAPLFHRSPDVRLSELGKRIKPLFKRIDAAAGEARLLTKIHAIGAHARSINGREKLCVVVRRPVGRGRRDETVRP